MQPPLPSLVPTWHNDTYPAIDPTRPELNQRGKTVIITGAGSGIGRETVVAFATAGAKHLVLIGRTESTLLETQKLIPSDTSSSTVFACSVGDETAIRKVAGAVGTWDVLIMNAAFEPDPSPIVSTNISDFWETYDTNVKSILICAQAFFPTASPSNAAVYALAAGALAVPPARAPGLSAYLTSKVAQAKMMEFLAAENPHMFICSVHPGMVDTKIFRKSGASKDKLPMDSHELSAHFLVWLTQPKTKFLSGRLVWANWDVDELCAQSEKIKSSTLLTIGYEGWPFKGV